MTKMSKSDINDKNIPDKDLKKRTKAFAIRIIKFVEYLNGHGPMAAKIIANKQLLRSGTAIAANYRASL